MSNELLLPAGAGLLRLRPAPARAPPRRDFLITVPSGNTIEEPGAADLSNSFTSFGSTSVEGAGVVGVGVGVVTTAGVGVATNMGLGVLGTVGDGVVAAVEGGVGIVGATGGAVVAAVDAGGLRRVLM